MRTGIYGIAATRPVALPGGALHLGVEGFHLALAYRKPLHAVQKAVLHADTDGIFGAHGVWMNASDRDWQDPQSMSQLKSAVASAAGFAETEGPLQGVHGDCNAKTLQLHGDVARQHPLYWTTCAWGILFAYSVEELVALMRDHDVPVAPDEEGAGLLLTYGSILGARTLIRGVRKLMPGQTLTWTPDAVSTKERMPLDEIERDIDGFKEATSLLDEVFHDSVSQMVAVNRDAGCVQHNLLSGGLDSRLVALATARHLDGAPLSTLCFAAKDSLDASISGSMAQEHGWQHRAHDLGHGKYMMDIESVGEYDGCVNHLASAHHRHALSKERLPNMGLLGSGQGANVLLTDNHKWGASGSQVLHSMTLNAATRGVCVGAAEEAWRATPDVQRFKMVNRGFLYTNSGAYSTAAFGVLWSPFTSGHFVRAALRLHPDILKGQRAYLTWLADRFPAAKDHVWERYNAKPVLGARLRLAQARALWGARFRRVLPLRTSKSMSPIEMWLDSSAEIQHFYNDTFRQLSPWMKHYPSLEATVVRDFATMNAMNKASVLTLLLATQAWFDA
ncbi:MAG TPA: hypothetical protein DHW55_06130 [Flavobacteriales bacterium]|nr:hypothetical protein [Flavobacteriales bacterium]